MILRFTTGMFLAALMLGFTGCDTAPSAGPGSTKEAPGAGWNRPDDLASRPHGWWQSDLDGSAKAGTIVESAAFTLEADQAIDPAGAASFSVRFGGFLELEPGGEISFQVEHSGGEATLQMLRPGGGTVTGTATRDGLLEVPWFRPAEDAGAPETVLVEVTFRRTDGSSRARLQTRWQRRSAAEAGGQGFALEPVPVSRVRPARTAAHEASGEGGAWSNPTGHALADRHRCVACHASPQSEAVLARRSPLRETLPLLRTDWLRSFAGNPHAVHAGTGMPRLFGAGPEERAEAEAIVHYLFSIRSAPATDATSPTSDETVTRGRQLYHEIGCVPCHGALDAPAQVFGEEEYADAIPEAPVPVPLGALGKKWRVSGLSRFLRDPLRFHPDGGMPSLDLHESEAEAIAAYLFQREGVEPTLEVAFEIDAGRAREGKKAFRERRCVQCHVAESDDAAAPVATTWSDSGDGCLASTPAPGVPAYGLGEAERASLRQVWPSLGSKTVAPIAAAHREFERLRCGSCHVRGDRGGIPSTAKVWCRGDEDIELGDEGRVPPPLDGVGWKLQSPWTRQVISGAPRTRPYMLTRMPRFPDRSAALIADGLARGSGVWPDETLPSTVTDEQVLAGREVAGENGLNCISCHVFADLPPAGVPGPDLAAFGHRLRPEWWAAYALDPPRFKPETRMPHFFVEGRSMSDVLGGDADRQIEALWAYFSRGAEAPVPEGVPSKNQFQLRPGGRPFVFRTFLARGGNRGVAVGYPIGMHFAFDAERMRLVESWTGDFLNAAGSWSGRGGRTDSRPGETVWSAPPGPTLVLGKEPESWPGPSRERGPGDRFRGYRLDAAGTPTLQYQLGEEGLEVEERFQPDSRPEVLFVRHFSVSGVPSGQEAWLNAGSGAVKCTQMENADVTPRSKGNTTWFRVQVKDPSRPARWTLEVAR